MSRESENTGFVCVNCGREVLPLTNGSYRNHCPFCLYSLHVDNIPGDRGSRCMGLMKPVDVIYNSKKGWQIVHQCVKCGTVQRNKTAELTTQPDDMEAIAKIINCNRWTNDKN